MNRTKKGMTILKCAALMAVMMAWMGQGMAQVADGVYYIQYTPTGNGHDYYLWPTAPTSNGWPCLTTFSQTAVPASGLTYNFGAFASAYCKWIVVTEGNYQHIINAAFGSGISNDQDPDPDPNGKYVYWISNSNDGRNVVLKKKSEITLTDSHVLYKITGTGDNVLIKPYNGSNSFNNKGDHQNYITSYQNSTTNKTGLLQFYNSNNKWRFISTKFDAPTIAFDDVTFSFTISTPLQCEYQIYYTYNNNIDLTSYQVITTSPEVYPYTTGSTIYPPVTGTVRAVVVGYGIVLTEIGSQAVMVAVPDTPVISINCDNLVTMTSPNMPTAFIYYTTATGDQEPEDPTNASTQYIDPISLGNGTKVKARAYNRYAPSYYSEVSDVFTVQTLSATPTITFTSASTATISYSNGAATIYYNLTDDGSLPGMPTSGSYTGTGAAPLDITFDPNKEIRISAIAMEAGMGASCEPATGWQLPMPAMSIVDEDCELDAPQSNKLTITIPSGDYAAWYAITVGENSAAPAINATPNLYSPYTSSVNLNNLDSENTHYTVHAYTKSTDGLHYSYINSVSHEMKTTGKPVVTPPTGSAPVFVISNGVYGDLAVCTIDMGTPETGDDVTTNVTIASDGTAQYEIPNNVNAVGNLIVAFKHGTWTLSCPTVYALPAAPATPVAELSCDNKLSLSTASPMAVIHYTINNTEPTLESPTYTEGCLYNIAEGTTVRAKSFEGFFSSSELTYEYHATHVVAPRFFVDGVNVTISSATDGASIYFTFNTNNNENEEDPIAEPADPNPVGAVTFNLNPPYTATPNTTYLLGNQEFVLSGITKFKAIAVKDGMETSCMVSVTTREGYSITNVTELNAISGDPTKRGKYWFIENSFDATGYTGPVDFTGVLVGNFNKISNLNSPLFNEISNNAVVRDLNLSHVNISTNGNAGAIACTAKGNTRVYNCGILPDDPDGTTTSSISGANNVGGLVGELQDNARVINCFSYANITGGDYRAGIVGNNNVTTASQQGSINSMIMNCMFYGNIVTTGSPTSISPVYGGKKISNAGETTGLNNYNYFRFAQPYSKDEYALITDFNCALGAQDRFLERFEFFRLILNSNRELASWYIKGTVTDAYERVAHWVLDKSIAPYPILKAGGGVYPSIINPDAANALPIDPDNINRNKGRKLGTLTVNISSVGSDAPQGATINNPTLTLNITDKDEANYNFNYKKVQLPYYHEVGSGNYTGNKVVAGWKITAFDHEGTGQFTYATYDYPDWNFVDRTCTDKDKYSVSGRVFNQGAYYEVPDGVSQITIEPYWAQCVYLSDEGYDVTYNVAYNNTQNNPYTGYPVHNVSDMGNRPTTFNGGQTVYNDFFDAHTALFNGVTIGDDATVYDYAIVLVGNYHRYFGSGPNKNNVLINDGKPFTIMSADMDNDNEPDNTFFYQHYARIRISPIRFDFINIPGIGMAQKQDGSVSNFQVGIFWPYGWFEITNTVLIHFGQFEFTDETNKTVEAPLILQGGLYEQFVSCRDKKAVKINYIHVGGNAWFKNFSNGCHTNQNLNTPKVPISVSGGDYDNFYLSGIYRPNWAGNNDNAECYIDGGRFGELAGAGMQVIKGNVTWLINAADIEHFYAGGINPNRPIQGNISTTISNSWVTEFCGGPKFGDMQTNKTIETTATNCHFGNFFGAGYGGTSFNHYGHEDKYQSTNYDNNWDDWVNSHYLRGYANVQDKYEGISTSYDYDYMFYSGGRDAIKVARFYVNYASLSLASTNNANSTLTGCTIGNFYGGGKLGFVNGDVVSLLTNCTVTGDVFGSGYSGDIPTVEVTNRLNSQGNPDFEIRPYYHNTPNIFNDEQVAESGYPAKVTYTWSNEGSNENPFTDEGDTHLIHTDVTLSNLGTVKGNVTLTIEGNSVVRGDVYGGGALANTNIGTNGTNGGLTQVNINGGTFSGNIYGGGKGDKASLGEGHSDLAVTSDQVVVNIGQETDEYNNIVFDNHEDNKGSVYGCNNINGSPANEVTVNVYVTKHDELNAATYTGEDATFAINNVFGGGNEADYTSTDKETTVNIYYCENTIRRVFGGGNAAATNGVTTNIDGGRFYQVFGGGNGERGPEYAANVHGDVHLNIHGGNVGEFYGGSNQNGTIDGTINIIADNTGPCAEQNLVVNEFFCGGNFVDVEHDLVTDINCGDQNMMNINNLYGGCNQACVHGNVILNVKGGNFDNVFGGSKGRAVGFNSPEDPGISADITGYVTLNLYGGTIENAFGGSNIRGNINGLITVNIIDIEGDCPLYVTNIYGSGNLNNYAPTDPNLVSPVVNVVHALYGIAGNVYGGGKGEPGTEATVSSNPRVNIGYVAADMNQYIPQTYLDDYSNLLTAPRAIVAGSVFGGGDAAKVHGNTAIYLRNRSKVFGNVYGGGNMGEVQDNPDTQTVEGNTKVIVNGANE